MSLLMVENMTQGFGDKMIFRNVSFRLEVGEHIGLVGANGQGKTTFLKLITEELLPDEGTIRWDTKVKVGYMDQNVDLSHHQTVREVLCSAFRMLYEMELEVSQIYQEASKLALSRETEKQADKMLLNAAHLQEILEDEEFYSIDSKVDSVANGLGISNLLNQDPQELSGGQRTKVILGKLLLEQPDVLLLDEPTNHLDEENIDWLKLYLNHYKKSFILISHDKSFLNDVVHVVYYLKNMVLTRYPGNYDQFLRLYKEKENATLNQYLKQQETIQKLENYIRKNKVRAATAVQAKSREKQLSKMERIEIEKKLPTPHFCFQYAKDSNQIILSTNQLVIGYDDALTRPLDLKICRGDKIALTGANGIGKTTLLKSLLGLIPAISGEVKVGDHIEVGYYEQELLDIPDTMVLNYAMEYLKNRLPKEVRSILARCGLHKEHILHSFSSLSGGEQSRTRLCIIMNHKSNVLFLDEPTNHLDQEAKDELKRAIYDYPGTVILVSHEKEVYKDCVNQVWDCREFQVNSELHANVIH